MIIDEKRGRKSNLSNVHIARLISNITQLPIPKTNLASNKYKRVAPACVPPFVWRTGVCVCMCGIISRACVLVFVYVLGVEAGSQGVRIRRL